MQVPGLSHTDIVPGNFWDGFVKARVSLEVAQAGEAEDAVPPSSGRAVSTATSYGGAVHTSGELLGTHLYPVGRGDDEDDEEEEEEEERGWRLDRW